MYHPATRLLTLLELLQAEGALSGTVLAAIATAAQQQRQVRIRYRFSTLHLAFWAHTPKINRCTSWMAKAGYEDDRADRDPVRPQEMQPIAGALAERPGSYRQHGELCVWHPRCYDTVQGYCIKRAYE